MRRISTRIEGLDHILAGGLPEGCVVLIAGVPGSGKTMLANQIVFNNATLENKALVITTISEPLAKMVRFTQEYAFFDVNKIGSAVIYEDISSDLLNQNGETAVERITKLVQKHSPAFLVVDSFKILSDLAESPASFRRMMYKLVATLATLPCTAFLIGEYETSDLNTSAEFVAVDAVIELRNQLLGLRDYRSLRVAKLRGSDYVSGEHTLCITNQGVMIFPRFVTPPCPVTYTVTGEQVATGIKGLDELFGKGILRGTATLVAGEPGTGKTVTSLHFLLNGAQAGEPGVYISFQEDPSQLKHIANNFGFDIDELQQQGMLRMFYTSPVELNVDQHAPLMLREIEALNAQRVVIDSITDFQASTSRDTDRYFNYIYALVQHFKNLSITSFFTAEMSEMFGTGIMMTGVGISHIVDNVILLRYVEVEQLVRRVLTVLKARGSAHSTQVREYTISERGGVCVGKPLSGLRV